MTPQLSRGLTNFEPGSNLKSINEPACTPLRLIEYELSFALPDESPLMELINKGLIRMKEKNEILPAWRNWIAGPCTGTKSLKIDS